MEETKIITNPIFGQEEIESLNNFYKMFQGENNLAPLHIMIENLENMEEFNTRLILKILTWMRKKNKSTYISFENFLKYLTIQLLPLDNKESRKKFFKLISDNGVSITIDDLKNFCYELSLNYSDEKIKELFQSFIITNQNDINFNDFERILDYSFKRKIKN